MSLVATEKTSVDATQKPLKRKPQQLKQPLNIIEIPDALLHKSTVAVLTGMSPSNVDRKTAAKKFPQPIKDGKRCTRWRSGDVREWLRAQASAGEVA